MSDNNDSMYLINGSTLTNIANAIRAKTGKAGNLYPSEMDEEIASISTGYQPITVNITQSEHQTITVKYTPNSRTLTSNGTISCPETITLNATITPESNHYEAGTLNQTSVVASWGDVISFYASAATEKQLGTLSFSHTLSEPADESKYRFDEEITGSFDCTAIGGMVLANEYNIDIYINNYCETSELEIPYSDLDSGDTHEIEHYVGLIEDFMDNNGQVQFRIEDSNTHNVLDSITISPTNIWHKDTPTIIATPRTANPTVSGYEDYLDITYSCTAGSKPLASRNLTLCISDENDPMSFDRCSTGRDYTYIALPNLQPQGNYTYTNRRIMGFPIVDSTYNTIRVEDDYNGIIDSPSSNVVLNIGSPYTVTKSQSTTGPYNTGDTITINYTFTATGCAPAAHQIYDELSVTTFNLPRLAYGATSVQTLSYLVTEPDILAGEITFDLKMDTEIDTFDVDSYTISNLETPHAHLTCNIDSITPVKSTYNEGDQVTITATVINDGNLSVNSVECGLYKIITSRWNEIESQTIADLSPGDSDNYTFLYDIDSIDAQNGSITFGVSATATTPDPDYPDIPYVNQVDYNLTQDTTTISITP